MAGPGARCASLAAVWLPRSGSSERSHALLLLGERRCPRGDVSTAAPHSLTASRAAGTVESRIPCWPAGATSALIGWSLCPHEQLQWSALIGAYVCLPKTTTWRACAAPAVCHSTRLVGSCCTPSSPSGTARAAIGRGETIVDPKTIAVDARIAAARLCDILAQGVACVS